MSMRYLHTMVRITNIEESLAFYCGLLACHEIRRTENTKGRYTLIFLSASEDKEQAAQRFSPLIELTYNWDSEDYGSARNFGHLAFEVDNIYEICSRLMSGGVKLNRPPRDGHMAFVQSPDKISIELLQRGRPLKPQEPWISMPNHGTW